MIIFIWVPWDLRKWNWNDAVGPIKDVSHKKSLLLAFCLDHHGYNITPTLETWWLLVKSAFHFRSPIQELLRLGMTVSYLHLMVAWWFILNDLEVSLQMGSDLHPRYCSSSWQNSAFLLGLTRETRECKKLETELIVCSKWETTASQGWNKGAV